MKQDLFFVYECLSDGSERLFKSGLTERQADVAFDELSLLLDDGCSFGCAVIGSLDVPSDLCVAQRLGII